MKKHLKMTANKKLLAILAIVFVTFIFILSAKFAQDDAEHIRVPLQSKPLLCPSGVSCNEYVQQKFLEEWIKNTEKNLLHPPKLKPEDWARDVGSMLDPHPDLKVLMDPLVRPNGSYYSQDDKELVDLIRSKYLLPPSKESYVLENPTKENSMGQVNKILQVLNNQREGFFIECGALDGETRSNTLTLEKDLGWSGILVEADLESLIKIKSKNRKAWLVPACLSTRNSTMAVTFRAWGHIGKIVNEKSGQGVFQPWGPDGESPVRMLNVTCLPVWSILQALDITTVDYFSLDIEGNELQVLKTIPFDKIFFKTLSVEFSHSQESGSSGQMIQTFMEKQGFYVHSLVIHPENLAHDFIFVHKSILSDALKSDTMNQSNLLDDFSQEVFFPDVDGQ